METIFQGRKYKILEKKNHSKYFRSRNFSPQSSRNLGNKSYFATQKELSVLELEILDATQTCCDRKDTDTTLLGILEANSGTILASN